MHLDHGSALECMRVHSNHCSALRSKTVHSCIQVHYITTLGSLGESDEFLIISVH